MRTLLIAALLLMSGLASARQFQFEKTIICDDTRTVFEYFQNGKYQEKPVWTARDVVEPAVRHVMMLNKQTGTWTLIQFDEQYACVLAAGEDYQLMGEKI